MRYRSVPGKKETAIFLTVALILVFCCAGRFLLSFLLFAAVPGLAAVQYFFGNDEYDRIELFILSVSVGLLIISAAVCISDFLPVSCTFLSAAIISASLITLITKRKYAFRKGETGAFLAVSAVAISAFLSYAPLLDLNVPLFADPAVEGTLARLIIDNGKMPDTWEPYMESEIAHQPGFASSVALLSSISGETIPRTINYLAIFLYCIFPVSVFIFAKTIFKDNLKSLLAVVVCAISAFPVYTYVGGMNSAMMAFAIIPAVASMAANEKLGRKRWPILASLSIGLVLIHPTSPFFLSLIVIPLFVFGILKRKDFMPFAAACIIIPLLFGLAYYSPSFETTLSEEQWRLQSGYINPEKSLSPFWFIEPAFTLFDNGDGRWYTLSGSASAVYLKGILFSFLILSSILAAILSKDRLAPGFVLMYLIFLAFSSFQSALELHFPLWSLIYPSRIKFLIIIPISLLIASSVDVRKRPILSGIAVASILISAPFCLIGINGHLSDLSKKEVVSGLDMECIEKAGGCRYVLNSLRCVEAGAFIGDGGQWIPAAAGVPVMFPATSLTEDLKNDDIGRRLLISGFMERGEIEDTEFLELLRYYGTDCVYVSRNHMACSPVMGYPDADDYRESSIYDEIYSNEDCSLFSVVYG